MFAQRLDGSFDQASMIVRTAMPDDHAAIATLHADSWRTTYRHILANDYLDHEVSEDRQDFWAARFVKFDAALHRVAVAAPDPHPGAAITGFVCVLLDEEPEYGALLDNLHVAPDLHRRGIGRRLMADAARWIAALQPDWSMHLWVYEANARSVVVYRSWGGREVDRRVIVTPAGNRAAVLRFEWREPLALASLLEPALERRTA